MNPNLSYRDMLQWAFALSPVPSYLPQYFSIMRQLTSVATTSTGTGAAEPGPEPEPTRATNERGGDHLRKRNWQLQDPQLSSIFKESPNSDGAVGLVAGGHSKSFEQQFYGANNGGGEGADPSKLDAGLSRATVLLLLSSHLLRLLYFHGVLLEERRPAPPIASAGSEPIEPAPTAQSDPPSRASALQWDLLGQSLSMIIVQLILLHATMLLRRKQIRRQRARMAPHGDVSGHSSTNSLSLSSDATGSPGSDHGYSNNHTLNDGGASCWQAKWRRLSHDMSAHFHNLFSPHSILQTHTFLEYLELLFLSSMVVKLVFDYHWYPRYGMGVVEGLKHTSICMESCLALPQMIRNYRNRTTEGLSVVMVGGWVAGDFFKLCYFLLSMISSGDADGPDNTMFALGSLLSLSLDSIVGMQMVWWYPEPWALRWRHRITRSARHWKTNKDDNLGELLLMNGEQMKDGLFASLLRTFFQRMRGTKLQSNNAT